MCMCGGRAHIGLDVRMCMRVDLWACMGVGGRGGGGACVPRVPDVSVIPGHNLIGVSGNLK